MKRFKQPRLILFRNPYPFISDTENHRIGIVIQFKTYSRVRRRILGSVREQISQNMVKQPPISSHRVMGRITMKPKPVVTAAGKLKLVKNVAAERLQFKR